MSFDTVIRNSYLAAAMVQWGKAMRTYVATHLCPGAYARGYGDYANCEMLVYRLPSGRLVWATEAVRHAPMIEMWAEAYLAGWYRAAHQDLTRYPHWTNPEAP